MKIEEFSPPDEGVEIKAEMMESWLNGRTIYSLSPKVMYDIQTILRHYKDIIVPGENVKIDYPNDDNGARCSVDNKKVYISTGHLEKGYVDETIGHMIHELNHIKMSDSERQTWATCYLMLEKVLDSLFVLEDPDDSESDYICLRELVMCDPAMSFDNLYSEDSEELKYGNFLRKALADIAFLLNAVEDIRIDTLCAYNLKKYINAGDVRVFSEWNKRYEEGEFNDNTLMNICYRLLFHHKDFIHDPWIYKVYGDKGKIVNSTPSQYTPIVLETFKDAIKDHVENLWGNVVEIPRFSFGSTAGDMYLGGMSESGNATLSDIAGGDSNIIERAQSDVGEIRFAESALRDPSQKKDGGEEFRMAQEQHSKPRIIGSPMMAAIHSFHKIQVYEAKEKLSDNWGEGSPEVDYSVVVYDALK